MARKLLLADDSITIQKVVELILADEGFDIRVTSNGEEALDVISSFRPDVILADIEMPRINGYQLCEKIKQDPSMRGIPVILLSGAFEPIDEKLAKQVNADDFIIKPFESQELTNKINAVLAVSNFSGREEIESIVEAVELEKATVKEDIWAMEEIPESAGVDAPTAEKGTEAGTEELIEIAEEAETEAGEAVAEGATLPVNEKPAEVKISIPEVELPSKEELKEIFENSVNERISSLLSTLDIREAILSSLMPSIKDHAEKILLETLSELTEKILRDALKAPLDTFTKGIENLLNDTLPDIIEKTLREELRNSFEYLMKETGKVTCETLPELIGGILKQQLKDSLESLTKEIEKAIWETIPDLAEMMISKEIERIRSEF
jgi:CheY-like chemotaxis protein